jgi:hypothetical protein
MTSTTWDKKSVRTDRLAQGYEGHAVGWSMASPPGIPGQPERVLPQLPDGAFGSMGGLYTSIRDYARYVSLQLDAWPPRDDPERGPVRRSSVRQTQQMTRYSRLIVTRLNVAEPIRVTALGYGFGWGAQDSCDFDSIISHGGGLPGFGSIVNVYLDQNVGVYAFTNATYSAPRQLVQDVVKVLSRHGAMEKRPVPISPALKSAQQSVLALLDRWEGPVAAQLFDRTFFQYNPPERVHSELEVLHQRHGRCAAAGQISASNALRGVFWLECDRGQIEAQIALSPDQPPRIQWIRLRPMLPPTEAFIQVARQVAREIGRASHPPLDKLFASRVDRDKAYRELEAVTAHSSCELTRWLESDGDSTARFELSCDRKPLELSLGLKSGQITSLAIRQRQEQGAKCPG